MIDPFWGVHALGVASFRNIKVNKTMAIFQVTSTSNDKYMTFTICN
jgi:hypothetical protein